MTRNGSLMMAGAVAALLIGSGCAGTGQEGLRDGFGDAVRHNIAQQTIHPEAGEQATEAAGLDGRQAESAVQRYRTARPEAASGQLINP
ncbi:MULTISPECIES: hypothetical protein [Halorhodospira]|uniref:hypothetical protein n=1 Tax=Halorhodospira TaxID=85108 RepID=UPI0019136437|nr:MULTISPECIES: hypothetical protein [Halorhodospira]MBK5937146.1 hypothetical protein [Halorhodospira halophila]MCG5540414.1 hypothetical protein [Halorhodospira sp. M39old]MCG5545733.1 hypothetical protein [Halorhodospira sp. M38]